MNRLPLLLVFVLFALASCGHRSNSGVVISSTGKDSILKVSQFDNAGMCDLLVDKSGAFHAVFQESPGSGKPMFIYYSTSTNKGTSWSKPVAISDDGSGAGSGYARILQDGSGSIYAIWKRYGNTSKHDVTSPVLDGPGGNGAGTLYYKVLSNGSWSNQVQLNEVEDLQETWFATVSPSGVLSVVWAQANPASVYGFEAWYYCDYMRAVALTGTTPSAYTDITKPSPLVNGYPSVKNPGYINLQGYVDKTNIYHLIWEDLNNADATQALKYFDGKTTRVVYNYPQYKQGNTFFNPGHLLVDENGNDHVIFVPPASTLQSEQIWDVNMTTNKTAIIASIQQQGISIHGFQASQGPNGAMAVTIEVGAISGSADAFGMYYKNGSWTNVSLTDNKAKTNFFSKEFASAGGGLASVSLLTTYMSQYASTAYDASGNKGVLMTIAGHTVSDGGYGVNNPFIIYIPVDR